MARHPLLRRARQLKAEGWTDHAIAVAVASGELVRVERDVYRWKGELAARDEHLTRVRAILLRQGHIAPLTAEDVVEVEGVRVTSLVRTVADLARTSEFTWAVVAADQALRRGVTAAQLLSSADAAPRMAGGARLRRVSAFADGRSGSIAESVSRVTIARAGVPPPTLQCEVTGAEGWAATSDFGWPEYRVVGEMDGEAKYRERLEEKKRAPERVFAAERVRDDQIRRADWWPTHWGWSMAWDVDGLGAKIREAFDDASRFRRRSRPII